MRLIIVILRGWYLQHIGMIFGSLELSTHVGLMCYALLCDVVEVYTHG